VAYALASPGAAGRELIQLYAGRRPLTSKQARRAAQLVETAGARAWATAQADRHLRAALDHLYAADPTSDAAADLAALARFAAHRRY
jgi:geranylgeranyl diphosphate synthase, type I